MISDLYQNDLERHFFALAPRAAATGVRPSRKGENLLAWLQAWLTLVWTWWGCRGEMNAG